MKNLNVKYKTNPILLERINIEGENNLINYIKLNKRYKNNLYILILFL